jgi:hypothetical protein
MRRNLFRRLGKPKPYVPRKEEIQAIRLDIYNQVSELNKKILRMSIRRMPNYLSRVRSDLLAIASFQHDFETRLNAFRVPFGRLALVSPLLARIVSNTILLPFAPFSSLESTVCIKNECSKYIRLIFGEQLYRPVISAMNAFFFTDKKLERQMVAGELAKNMESDDFLLIISK